MSARAAIYDLLSNDAVLSSTWNINEEVVFPNGELDVAPRDRYFLVIRWGEETIAFGTTGTEVLTIWAHCPRAMATDYVALTSILMRITDMLLSSIHVAGEDGILTTVRYNGMSADFNDETLHTMSKNAAFTVVSRAATVE